MSPERSEVAECEQGEATESEQSEDETKWSPNGARLRSAKLRSPERSEATKFTNDERESKNLSEDEWDFTQLNFCGKNQEFAVFTNMYV